MTSKDLAARITVDSNIQHGKPCIKGTRTPVYVLLEALALGMPAEEIKREYPPLTDDDLRAVLWFAAYLANEREIAPSAESAR